MSRWWRQFWCNHYWMSDYANPFQVNCFTAKCKKCDAISNVPGYAIDEIKKIAWTSFVG